MDFHSASSCSIFIIFYTFGVWLFIVHLFRYKIVIRLAGDHLHGKWLFTWLSPVMYLMVSYFVLSFFHETSWMRSGTERVSS